MRCERRSSRPAPARSATTRTAVGASPAPANSCRRTALQPAIGSVGAVEQVVEDRVEVVAPARVRGRVLAAMRAAHPYEEPAFDIVALAPTPGDVGLGRIGSLPRPEPLSAFVSRVRARAAANVMGSARRR